MKLFSQAANVLLVPAACQTLCGDCDPPGPFLGCCQFPGGNIRILSVGLPGSTSGDTGPVRAGQGDTSSTSVPFRAVPLPLGSPCDREGWWGIQGCEPFLSPLVCPDPLALERVGMEVLSEWPFGIRGCFSLSERGSDLPRATQHNTACPQSSGSDGVDEAGPLT